MDSARAKHSPSISIDDYPKVVVFYDGDCPLCQKEIRHYQRIDRNHRLMWLDIAAEPVRLRSYGLTTNEAMKRFHVLDQQGEWQTGANAFIELWSHLPYYRRLASIARLLRLHVPLEFAYRHWATWRLRRRCTSESCQPPRD